MPRSSEFKSDEPLYINSCDCQHLYGRDMGSYREKGRVDYHILYITEGALFIRENGKEIRVDKGNVILYLPYETQDYYCKKDIKTTSYYIHFTGSDTEKLLSDFSLSGRVIKVGLSYAIESAFKKMIEEHYLKRPYSKEAAKGYFLSILALLGRGALSEGEKNGFSGKGSIDEILREMIENFDKDKDISFYAEICNLSVSRFIHKFKSVTGKSPKEYITYIRLEKAKELLADTNLNVGEVGAFLGYDDQNYFSRIFKKYTGISPNKYRKSSY